MNTNDNLDELAAEHLRVSAPTRAPDRLLDATMARIAATPQHGSGWRLGRTGRLLAVAAVVLLAVVAGSQLSGLIGREVGADPSSSPSVAPSVPPASGTAEPSATVAPTATPAATVPPVTGDELVVRLLAFGGGPTSPVQLIPWMTLLADGTVVWTPVPSPEENPSLVTRTLTADGLAALRNHIFGGGLLDASAAYELERRPDAPEPPGRGIGSYEFTAPGSGETVVVTAVEWLGDEEEATYYQPSPEREQLDALARQLRDPESLVDASAWTGPATPYEGTEYLLSLTVYADVPPYVTTDIAEIPLPLDGGSVAEFGDRAGFQPPMIRCGVITAAEAALIIDAIPPAVSRETGLARVTVGSFDWAEGNGTVDLAMIPRVPSGYPACEPPA